MSLVLAAGTWDGAKVVPDDQAMFHLRLRLAGFGDGERVTIRVESEPDAKRHHQLEWYWGYILPQVAANGETENRWDRRFRRMFLPPGVNGRLSRTTYEQMADYIVHCEEYAARVAGVVIQGPDEARRFVAA